MSADYRIVLTKPGYEKIEKEIGARYTLGFVSTDEKADGSWRPVEVKVQRKGLERAKIRTRPSVLLS